MVDFVAGMISMGYAVAGLFFLRFWARTSDALFAIFAVAFWLMALNQTLAAMMEYGREELGWVYLLRLAAFVLIIGGILQKNLRARPARAEMR
jgi:membrane-associated PAP2 superfamily phosphatase